MRVRCFVSLLLLSSVLVSSSVAFASPAAGKVASEIDDFFSRSATFGFSGSVLVAIHGEVVLSKGYGWADRAKQIPATPQTAFAVASITKTFTAAAIMKLEQAGKLKTSDTIGKFFPSAPPDKAGITIHQLLSHTSGLDDTYAGAGILDRDAAVEKILSQKLIAAPGEKFNYTNDGYNLLAAIIEVVSGKSYPAFVREQLLKPAGMTRTGLWGEKGVWPQNSVAHNYNSETDNGSPVELEDHWGDRGAGDMITTTEDVYRWDRALRGSGILPQEAVRRMTTPYTERRPGMSYGYGWFVITTPRGTTDLYHGGGDTPRGVTAALNRYMDEDIVTIVIVNSMIDELGLLYAVREPLNALLFGGALVYPPTSNAIAFDASRYAGTYTLSAKDTITVAMERGQLVARGEGQEAIGMLIGYDPDLKQQLLDCSRRIQTALESGQKGVFGSELSEEQWKAVAGEHGNLRSFEMLGTAPVSTEEKVMTTYARLQFADHTEVVRWVWSEDRVVSVLAGSPSPVVMPLAPVVKDRFVTYHLLMKTGALVTFTVDDSGTAMSLKSDYGSVDALKRE